MFSHDGRAQELARASFVKVSLSALGSLVPLGPDHFAKSKVIVLSPTCQLKGFGGHLFYYSSLRDPLSHHFPLSSPQCSPADSSLFFITVTFSEALEYTHCPAWVIFKVTSVVHTYFLQVSRTSTPQQRGHLCRIVRKSSFQIPKAPFLLPCLIVSRMLHGLCHSCSFIPW